MGGEQVSRCDGELRPREGHAKGHKVDADVGSCDAATALGRDHRMGYVVGSWDAGALVIGSHHAVSIPVPANKDPAGGAATTVAWFSDNDGTFSVEPKLPFSVPANGAQDSLAVMFKPTERTSSRATLMVQMQWPDGHIESQAIKVTGHGIEADEVGYVRPAPESKSKSHAPQADSRDDHTAEEGGFQTVADRAKDDISATLTHMNTGIEEVKTEALAYKKSQKEPIWWDLVEIAVVMAASGVGVAIVDAMFANLAEMAAMKTTEQLAEEVAKDTAEKEGKQAAEDAAKKAAERAARGEGVSQEEREEWAVGARTKRDEQTGKHPGKESTGHSPNHDVREREEESLAIVGTKDAFNDSLKERGKDAISHVAQQAKAEAAGEHDGTGRHGVAGGGDSLDAVASFFSYQQRAASAYTEVLQATLLSERSTFRKIARADPTFATRAMSGIADSLAAGRDSALASQRLGTRKAWLGFRARSSLGSKTFKDRDGHEREVTDMAGAGNDATALHEVRHAKVDGLLDIGVEMTRDAKGKPSVKVFYARLPGVAAALATRVEEMDLRTPEFPIRIFVNGLASVLRDETGRITVAGQFAILNEFHEATDEAQVLNAALEIANLTLARSLLDWGVPIDNDDGSDRVRMERERKPAAKKPNGGK